MKTWATACAVVKDGIPYWAQIGGTMQSEPMSGDEQYFRTLFPTVLNERQAAIYIRLDHRAVQSLRANEVAIARAICAALWNEREARKRFKGGAERRECITIDYPELGEVSAVVCLGCRWVAWANGDANYVDHPGACLGEALQDPDDRPGMRVTPNAADLEAGPWGPYFDAIYPRALLRGYAHCMRTSTGGAKMMEVWDQRENLRRSAGVDALEPHHGVVLTAGSVAYAACTTCQWIERPSLTSEPDWHDLAGARARRHELMTRKGFDT